LSNLQYLSFSIPPVHRRR